MVVSPPWISKAQKKAAKKKFGLSDITSREAPLWIPPTMEDIDKMEARLNAVPAEKSRSMLIMIEKTRPLLYSALLARSLPESNPSSLHLPIPYEKRSDIENDPISQLATPNPDSTFLASTFN